MLKTLYNAHCIILNDPKSSYNGFMLKVLRFIVALVVCTIAILLPYRLRIFWYRFVGEVVHLPFRIFGYLSKTLLSQLKIENPYEK